jgi:riboflavin kinase / FMN adenylyltransferase
MKTKLLKGRVIKGEGWATLVGFPTANIDRKHFYKNPIANGIYAGWVKIGRQQKKYRGLSVIGVPSFFRAAYPKVEVYILDFKKNILGRTIEFEVVEKVRSIKKFADTTELIKQMKQDEAQARRILK